MKNKIKEAIRFSKRTFILVVLILIMTVSAVSGYVYKSGQLLENNITIVNSDISEDVYEVNVDVDYDVYDLMYQQLVSDEIEDNLDDTSIDNPFLIYNPFGTNFNAINVYFNDYCEKVSYTIKVAGYQDYSQSLNVEGDGYQIIGLISGETNTLILNVDDHSYEYVLKMPKTSSDVSNQLETVEGTSSTELSNGLYAMLGKDTRSNIFLYDNNGTLRGELMIKDDEYRSDRILTIDDNLVYCYSESGFISVNSQGMIEDKYDLNGYTMHHDFIYDDKNHRLLVLANKNNGTTIEDMIVSLDLETKLTTTLVDMKDLLPDMYEDAVMPESGINTYGGDELDWIHLNSLTLSDDGSLIVSSRELSSIIKLNDIDTNVSIDYIMADESLYDGYEEYSELLLNKDGDFISQTGQHMITYVSDESLKDDQYYLIMYNNNFGNSTSRPNYDWSNIEGVGNYKTGDNSYFYKYLVDDDSYSLVESIALPYSAIVSSVEYYQDNLVTCSGRDGSYGEYDEDGNLIRQFNYEVESHAYRVLKYSFDIWFN